jgi:hypothetical protein
LVSQRQQCRYVIYEEAGNNEKNTQSLSIIT